MAQLNINKELNGIEIIFDGKPDAATLDALKANGYRWHRVKKLWYAKNTAERLALAESLTESAPVAISPASEVINLDNLGIKPANFSYHGADLAKLIREDLKKRGVKGVTVRNRMSGYTTGITITVKTTAADFVSIEEGAQRFNISAFSCDLDRGLYTNGRYLYISEWDAMTDEEKTAAHLNYIAESIKKINSVQFGYCWASRAHYWEFTADFWEKLTAIYKIANQWNYCNDDIMTDYFDRGYYLDIELKKADDFAPRQEMTDADRTAYQAEQDAKRKEIEEADRKAEEERKQAEEEAKKRKEWEKEARARIANNIKVVDLDASEQLYITNLKSGIGKECNLDEVRESIADRIASPEDAEITRKIIFTDRAALDDFNKMFLYDFEFLANKGGSASQDTRIPENLEPWNFNEEQRETIKFYICDAVAVYFCDELQYIIDPEGFSYARYVFLTTESTEIKSAAEELKKQEDESKEKPAFYFPESVEKQADNLHIGQEITIYQCDGWILNSISGGAGIVTGFYISDYAQYKNCLIIELMDKRGKITKTHIRNNKKCLIYEGIKKELPEEVTNAIIKTGTGYTMREMYNADILIPNTYNYYKNLGELPIIDTWQR